jgi:hypothetical protein
VSEGTVYFMLFNVYLGTLAGKHEYTFDETEGFLEEFLPVTMQTTNRPKRVILPEPVDEAVIGYLSHLRAARSGRSCRNGARRRTCSTLSGRTWRSDSSATGSNWTN